MRVSFACAVAVAFASAGCGHRREHAHRDGAAPTPIADPAPSVGPPDAAAEAQPPDASPTAPPAAKPKATDARGPQSTERCTLRVSAKGISVDGDATSEANAVTLCKQRAAAIVILDDDAPPARWRTLESALRRARVPILMRGPLGHAICQDNPLATGCR